MPPHGLTGTRSPGQPYYEYLPGVLGLFGQVGTSTQEPSEVPGDDMGSGTRVSWFSTLGRTMPQNLRLGCLPISGLTRSVVAICSDAEEAERKMR
jgi:hypothetical protein